MGSYADANTGNPYGPLLEQIYNVLTTSAALTAMIPAQNIGMNMRKSLQYPAIEFGIENAPNDSRFRDTPRASVFVYGTDNPEDTVIAADIVKTLMKPKLLTNRAEGVFIASSRCNRNVILPQDDYGLSVSLSFLLKYVYYKE